MLSVSSSPLEMFNIQYEHSMCTFGRRDRRQIPPMVLFFVYLGIERIDLPSGRHDGEYHTGLSSEVEVGWREGETKVKESTVLSFSLSVRVRCVKSWRRIGGLGCPSASLLRD
jgi:hypothetical protein